MIKHYIQQRCSFTQAHRLPRLEPPIKPYRVLPIAAGFQDGLNSLRAVRRVSRVGGDEAAEQLLAARRVARRRGGGAPSVIVVPAMMRVQ